MTAVKIPEDSIPDYPIKKVQLDALVLMQILNTSNGGRAISGQLLGVEEKGVLILTNSFPVPTLNSIRPAEASNQTVGAANAAAAAAASGQSAPEENAGPSTSATTPTQTFEDENSIREYQSDMIEVLRTMEYEINEVGWYSTYASPLIPFDEIIENQFSMQSENRQAIHIMYEPKRTEYQSPILTALRLTDEFMKFYATRNFSGKSVKTHQITYKNIFELLEIEIKNSFTMNAVYGEYDLSIRNSSDSATFDGLLASSIYSDSALSNIISSEKYLERQLEALIDCVEDQGQEYWRWQAWHRGYQKEQQKVNSTLQRMHYENEKGPTGTVVHSEAALAAAATSVGLGKSIAGEPGRLDTLILSKHIDMLTDHLGKFTTPLE